MSDSLDAKQALHTALLAKTRAGRVFKLIVFWIAVIGMFVIPLGVLALYFLWKHGNAVAVAQSHAQRSSDLRTIKST
ncbi:hypothetical protein BI364_12945 [Acidihalobacter yilgarnensis]|uniref:Uncharacterized protein n=1 Tax=Acidihalobacter yilgarnensis TaxID=2819280 RepID=A0A1D8IQG5_9GAMM|nr:hypothetical protein [Acidihalobacter yilgarnensis]AOU98750.1 hypothetical protein BI364_12945 [Acidihalobacter yilgarnensis]